jgi:hypothetical protein
MSFPGHFPLSRAESASTIADEDLNQSIATRVTTIESRIESEVDSEGDSESTMDEDDDDRCGDFQRQGSVNELQEECRILIWIKCHEKGRGLNTLNCNCLHPFLGDGKAVVQCFRACRDIVSKKNRSGDNSVHNYISTILSSK